MSKKKEIFKEVLEKWGDRRGFNVFVYRSNVEKYLEMELKFEDLKRMLENYEALKRFDDNADEVKGKVGKKVVEWLEKEGRKWIFEPITDVEKGKIRDLGVFIENAKHYQELIDAAEFEWDEPHIKSQIKESRKFFESKVLPEIAERIKAAAENAKKYADLSESYRLAKVAKGLLEKDGEKLVKFVKKKMKEYTTTRMPSEIERLINNGYISDAEELLKKYAKIVGKNAKYKKLSEKLKKMKKTKETGEMLQEYVKRKRILKEYLEGYHNGIAIFSLIESIDRLIAGLCEKEIEVRVDDYEKLKEKASSPEMLESYVSYALREAEGRRKEEENPRYEREIAEWLYRAKIFAEVLKKRYGREEPLKMVEKKIKELAPLRWEIWHSSTLGSEIM